jgi:hypothetical protein
MTFEEFKDSLSAESPPDGINDVLKSLWYDANDDWEKAHSIAQDIQTKDGALLHAYLHRVEGDVWNAGYWYNRAHSGRFKGSLEQEWEFLARRFLA